MNSRSVFAALWLASAAYAGPALTTIQDVLYKADGTRFNGSLTISWKSFDTVDNSNVVMQTTTTKVVDGNLRVQLVPSTTAFPAGAYSVLYNSDGRIQFQEKWAVPASSLPLRVRDVRMLSANTTAPETAISLPVQEADVVGLIADLGARPSKGTSFAAGRVAMVNSTGLLETVAGTATDCVRVDGSTGPCGALPPSFVDGDSLTGIVDGANAYFSVSAPPEPVSSLSIYRNGLLQKLGFDYTFSGRTAQFVTAAIPQPGDTLLASYRLGGTEATAPQSYPTAQVLCSGTGASTAATALASIGTCSIPSGVLTAGDRVEIRFDFEHSGAAAGFSFEVRWGSTVLVHRDGAASDVLAAGRGDAATMTQGARLNVQSWGTVLPLIAGVASASDSYAAGITIDFQGKVVNAADSLALRNYTVLRLP